MLTRINRWALAALVLLTLPLLAARAQERRTMVYGDRQARLGVMLDMEADSARDRLGAEVEEVVPGSPAEQAGLEEGDVITKFNGTALGGAKAADAENAGPAHQLVELARKLQPGDTVKVEYLREGKTRQATLVAKRLGRSFARFDMPDLPRMMEMPKFRFDVGPGRFNLMYGAMSGLDLVSLNPDLGDYFGTKEGVLVVQAPSDSTLALKGGDVILAIDGRKPRDPDHALRIIGSYTGGETVKLDVLRQKKKVTVSWTVPQERENWWKGRTRTRHDHGEQEQT